MNHIANIVPAKQFAKSTALAVGFVALLAIPDAFAQAEGNVQGFFERIQGLLQIASIAIVTIAIIFSGYQIAFNHKRIGDVAPVLIGGFLIGAAAQIAALVMGANAGE